MKVWLSILLLLVGCGAFAQPNYRSVDTLAQLLVLRPETVTVGGKANIQVAGYAEPGDWGGFRIARYQAGSALSTNLGCVFTTSGGAGQWVFDDCDGPTIDARWFGAILDDGDDDILAYESARDFIYDRGTGGTIVIPAGVLDVSRTVKLRPRVNLLGPGVNFASVRTDTNYTATGNGVFLLMAGANVPLLANDDTVGQLYQPDEVMFDGSTNQSRLYQLSVKGLVFHANGDNQTAGPADAIHLDSVWGIDIEGCAFMRPRGYVGRFRNANAVNVRNCTFGGSTTRSKGLLMEAVADVRWSDVTVFQHAGPGYHWVSSAYGHYVNLYQFGGVFPRVDGTDYWWTNFASASVTNDIITIAGGVPFENGDAIQFVSTTGNLFGVNDFTTYYVHPITSNTFTVNRNYRLATNGVALPLTPLFTGSGTVEVGIGPNSGALLTESLILGVHSLHVDENLDGGVQFWNASDNQIVGLTSHRNAGTPGSGFATNVTSAIRFRGSSSRNIVSAPTVRDATNAVTLEFNAGDNRILGLSPNLVLTNFVTVSGGLRSWFDAVRDIRTRTLWLDTADASPSWKAQRAGSATIDFAVAGTSADPQWFLRESTNATDTLWFQRFSGINALSIGGNTYSADNTNHAAALYGSVPSGGHATNLAAKPFLFHPSLGTGSGDTNAGLFEWRLPTSPGAGTTVHGAAMAMLLSSTNLIVVPPLLSIGPSVGDRGSLQYVASTDAFRVISPATVEVWAGTADREFAVTSAGIIMDSGKGVSLNGVLRTTWPTDATTLNGQGPGYYLNRANHTNEQAIATITGLQTALDERQRTNAILTGLQGLTGGTAGQLVVSGGSNTFTFEDGTGHDHAASNIISGVLDPARMGSGTPSTNTFLQGQGAGVSPVWATIPSTPSPTNGIADAPADGTLYARLNNSWTGVDYAQISGASSFVTNWIRTVVDDIDGLTQLGLISGTPIDIDSNARVTVRKNTGSNVGVRRRLNFIEGSGVSLTVADDGAGEEVDVTVGLASMTASRLLGRGDASSGAPQEITLGSGLAMSGATLSATATTGTLGIVKKSAAYTATSSDTVIVCTFSSDEEITLPVSGISDGKTFTVIRTGGAGLVTVKDASGNTLATMNTARSSWTWVWCDDDSTFYPIAYVAGS